MHATSLRDGLTEFIAALERQRSELRDQGERLAMAWQRTRDVYRGQGADAFIDAFERSSSMLKSYVEILETVLPILHQRLEALDHFDFLSHPQI